eukprot:747458-Hanusia_phi.AAC.4
MEMAEMMSENREREEKAVFACVGYQASLIFYTCITVSDKQASPRHTICSARMSHCCRQDIF